MLREASMMERWFFYQDGAGLWKWARLDILGTVLGHSGGSFETRDACVEHAALNGYEERSARSPEGSGLGAPRTEGPSRRSPEGSGLAAPRTEGNLPRFPSVTSLPPK